MIAVTNRLALETVRSPQFIDITQDVLAFARHVRIQNGIIVAFSRHTTAAIKINENEPLLLEDLKDLLKSLAPREEYYRHNDFDIRTVNMHPNEPKNGHSHCQHLMLGTSETIPLISGNLQLGEWQSVFLIELDESRDRRVTVSIVGM